LGFGGGVRGVGVGPHPPNPQSPIPNPQSPLNCYYKQNKINYKL